MSAAVAKAASSARRLAVAGGAALIAVAAAYPAAAGPLAIANSPLFLGTGVEPNLIIAVDD